MGKSLIDAHLYQQMVGKFIFSCNYVLTLFLLLAMLINLVQNFKSHGCCKTHLYVCKVLLKWACSIVEGRNVFCLGFQMYIGLRKNDMKSIVQATFSLWTQHLSHGVITNNHVLQFHQRKVNTWCYQVVLIKKGIWGESVIKWYHKEHHILIFQDPSNFGKIQETHKERFFVIFFVEYITQVVQILKFQQYKKIF